MPKEVDYLTAPFPYFGGKSKIAKLVWQFLGDVEHYVEPFVGSAAVLLGRPLNVTGPLTVLLNKPYPNGTETINDADPYIVNFWRAVKYAPEEVAYWANNPVFEIDLLARHLWLVNEGRERLLRVQGDPEYYDPKVAGWWAWGLSCWIGAGFCSGNGPWYSIDGKLTHKSEISVDKEESGVVKKKVHLENTGQGVNKQLVHLGNAGKGVNKQLVHLGDAGQGVNRKRIHLIDAGVGVNRKRVHLMNAGIGVNKKSIFSIGNSEEEQGEFISTRLGEDKLIKWFNVLAERLRYVRIVCGDWSRVVTRGALDYGREVGIFLDPPYTKNLRHEVLYNKEADGDLNKQVEQWCKENQDNPRYRIVLAGYEGEYDLPGWKIVAWKANRAFGTSRGDTANVENRGKERLWISPNCVNTNTLFGDENG
jgi:site-specific DNA-adenine methylase